MRYEAKTERDAVEAAAKALNRTPESIKYRVIRDEKSFWGGRVVEIEIEGEPEIAAPDLLRDRARPRGLEALAVERPARRAREVAVDQRGELGALGALDALQVRERVGLAGAVGLDELLEQVLDDVAHAASSFGPSPSCPLSARRNRDTIWCTLASDTPSISCAA